MRCALALAVLLPIAAACSDAPEATTTTTTTPQAATTTTTTAAVPEALTIDELVSLGRPIVLAHTGGEDEFPASTPFAFARSMEAGVDMLDLNVLLSKDGVLVVQHDDTVDRSTNGTGAVADLTYAELHELDNAYWFTAECVCAGKPDADYIYRGMRTGDRPPPAGFTAEDFVIPRLRDVVAAHPTAPLGIEIKGEGDAAIATARVLANELRELDRLDAVVISSFDDAALTAFHQLEPDVELSPGLDALTGWVLQRTPVPDGMRILQLPPEYSGLQIITSELVADSKAAGYLIWVWPNDRSLENLQSYLGFLEQGVDGLNINFPATGVAAVEEFTASS